MPARSLWATTIRSNRASSAADRRVKDIGGTARTFAAGRVYRMALESPIDDCFLGGIVNQYFGQDTGPLYWAIWTDAAD